MHMLNLKPLNCKYLNPNLLFGVLANIYSLHTHFFTIISNDFSSLMICVLTTVLDMCKKTSRIAVKGRKDYIICISLEFKLI